MAGCTREYEARRTANMLQSSQVCERAEIECENVLEREQSGMLPSTGALSCHDVALSTAVPSFAINCLFAWSSERCALLPPVRQQWLAGSDAARPQGSFPLNVRPLSGLKEPFWPQEACPSLAQERLENVFGPSVSFEESNGLQQSCLSRV